MILGIVKTQAKVLTEIVQRLEEERGDKENPDAPTNVPSSFPTLQPVVVDDEQPRALVTASGPPSAEPTTHEHRVRVVLYFDESYDLTHSTVMVRPSSPSQPTPPPDSAFTVLCRCLDLFSDQDIFHIFLSTSSNLSHFSPPKAIAWSARARDAKMDTMQTPFVELPFDNWKNGRLIEEGKHGVQNVCKPEFMVRFGRPL